MSTAALWYLSRGTGVVSLALLTVVVVLGILTRGNAQIARWPRFVVSGLHRNAALLAVSFLAVHITTAVLDPYAALRLTDVVLPFGSQYRPLWVGLGAIGFDLLAAIVVTSLVRVRLGLRAWRGVHLLAYAAWPLALLHGLGAGTDARAPWMAAYTYGVVGAAVAAVLWRLAGARSGGGLRRAAP